MTRDFASISFLAAGILSLQAQTGGFQDPKTINPITTAVPFLLFAPDSRQSALGDVGAATDPDVSSIHWNGSKLAFIRNKLGVGFTVTPWLRRIIPDLNLYYLSGYGRIGSRIAAGASVRYFKSGSGLGINDLAADIACSYRVSKGLAAGVAARYISAGIVTVTPAGSIRMVPVMTFAFDASLYWKSDDLGVIGKKTIVSTGLALTNIGPKLGYLNDRNFLPMNMRLGGGIRGDFDDRHSLGLYIDFNKLLVPSPPLYKFKVDVAGNRTNEIEVDPLTGNRIIENGMDPNVPVPAAIIQSFYDAPGGFQEEIDEIVIGTGVEYTFRYISLRCGYFNEAKTKGARQLISYGAGVRIKSFTIDATGLVPLSLQHPLQGTWRVTLSYNFGMTETVKPMPD